MKVLVLSVLLSFAAPLVSAEENNASEFYTRPVSLLLENPTTLSELVEELRANGGLGKTSILMPPDVGQVTVPALKVKDVSLETLFKTLAPVCGLKVGYEEGRAGGLRGILVITRRGKAEVTAPQVTTSLGALKSAGEPLTFTQPTIEPVPLRAAKETKAFSVAVFGQKHDEHFTRQLHRVLEEHFLTEAVAERERPEINFYRSAQILVVRGTGNQVAAAEAIVGAFLESVGTRFKRVETETAEIRHRIQQTRVKLDIRLQDSGKNHPEAKVAQKELGALEDRLVEMERELLFRR